MWVIVTGVALILLFLLISDKFSGVNKSTLLCDFKCGNSRTE